MSRSRVHVDVSGVRSRGGSQAGRAAHASEMSTSTAGEGIVSRNAMQNPSSYSGQSPLAYELAHVVQGRIAGVGSRVIRRETAAEIKGRYTNWGGLNLQEELLAAYLVGLARGGSYALVTEVINVLPSSDRDDVAGEMAGALSARELIGMKGNADAVAMLRLMRNELRDSWGWTTESEQRQADLLGAVLDDHGERNIWNRGRIETIKDEAGTDLEALARMFEDDLVIDDGSVATRLQAVLAATTHLVIPGLQTGIEFSDIGFAGDRESSGAGFRDPHPSSRNQPGHFLTAVGLQFSPGTVSRPIPGWAFFCDAIGASPEMREANTIRAMVGAQATMSDRDVALRLTIGHEKAPDPSGTPAVLSVLLAGLVENVVGPAPAGETEEQRDRRVGEAVLEETRRQVAGFITAFRTQFRAATEEDVAAWNEALAALGSGERLDMAAAEAPLRRISIDPSKRGNSLQDLRLSLVGWRLGQLIAAGAFPNGAAVAAWIRANLGESGALPARGAAPAPTRTPAATPTPTPAPSVPTEVPVRPKLRVGSPNDPEEQDADRVAEQILGSDGSAAGARAEASLQRSATGPAEGTKVGSDLSLRVESLQGGRALPASERSFMEPRVGRRLDSIRIHTGPEGASLARELNARAFSVGNDIAFASGEFQPGTASGRRLLAHEIAHVIQERGGSELQPTPRVIRGQSRVRVIDVEDTGRPPPEGVTLPTLPDPQVGLVDQDSGECVALPLSEIRDSPQYVDNDIERVEARPLDWLTLQVDTMDLIYGSGQRLTFWLDTIDHSPRARADSYERRDGVIWPLDSTGAVMLDAQNTPNIVAFASAVHEEIARRHEERIEMGELVVAFAGAIGRLGGVYSMTSRGLWRPTPRGLGVRGGSRSTRGSRGGTRQPPRQPPRSLGSAQRGTRQPPPARQVIRNGTTSHDSKLRGEGYVRQGLTPDKTAMAYRNPRTGERVEIQLRRGGPGWIKPQWGRNRLEQELRDRGFRYVKPTKGEGGQRFRNQSTGEELRIMPRPAQTFRNEPIEKHLNSNYFRYRPLPDQAWGDHTTIPDVE
jgi:hypothetical protein